MFYDTTRQTAALLASQSHLCGWASNGLVCGVVLVWGFSSSSRSTSTNGEDFPLVFGSRNKALFLCSFFSFSFMHGVWKNSMQCSLKTRRRVIHEYPSMDLHHRWFDLRVVYRDCDSYTCEGYRRVFMWRVMESQLSPMEWPQEPTG